MVVSGVLAPEAIVSDYVAVTVFPPSPLDERTLYFGDNGRVMCGKAACAGCTAYHTGRDLSGQRLEAMPARVAHEEGFRCETCKFQPSLIVTP